MVYMVVLKRTGCLLWYQRIGCLSTESVQGASLPLEGVDDIHGGDGLPLGVLGVGDGVADHVLQEDLKDAPGFLVDEARDALNAAPPGKAPDGGLRDALQYKRYGPSIRCFPAS